MKIILRAAFFCSFAAITSNTWADDDLLMAKCPSLKVWETAAHARAERQAIPHGAPTMPALRAELLAMMGTDQAVRGPMMSGDGHALSTKELHRMWAVDRHNLNRFKIIFRRLGMPTITQVGQDGAEAAFLIVQHASDQVFQARALQSMQRRIEEHEAAPPHYALLLDRVLMFQGKPQRYGSQFKTVDGRNVLEPVEDSMHLDELRDAMFLPPIEAYACTMRTMYGLPVDLSALGAPPSKQQ